MLEGIFFFSDIQTCQWSTYCEVLKIWVKCNVIFSPAPPPPPHDSTFKFIDVTVTHLYTL